MRWTAVITGKSALDASENITYTINIVGGGEVKAENVEVTGAPSDIQQLIEARVTSFAAAYDLATNNLPAIGEELVIIANGG